MSEMARKPYLSRERTRHGKYVWYFKKDGRRVRLPDVYGSDEFNRAYDLALAGLASIEKQKPGKARSGTFKWLVEQYMRSAAFAELAPSTRRHRGNMLKTILEDPKRADAPFTAITKAQIRMGMDRRATIPNAANNFLKTMAHLFKWAEEGDLVEVNPCVGVRKMRVKTDGFHTWTVEQVRQYREFHKLGTRARLAIDLLLFLHLRRSDVILVGRQHVSGSTISIRTQKTKTLVELALLPPLKASIEATKTGDLAFLVTESGKPFASGASFGNWFAKQVKAAGLPDTCRAHGLRKAGATIAAEEGASAHELMAMFGWSDLEMANHYTQKVARKDLAKRGGERLANKF